MLASGSEERFVLKTVVHKHFSSRRCKPKPYASKSIYYEAMYLSIDLSRDLNAVSIITYISTFVGFVVHDSTLNLNTFFTATCFKVREHQLKKHNTTRCDPQLFRLLYKQKQVAVIRYLASRLKTKTSRSKQCRLLLSR